MTAATRRFGLMFLAATALVAPALVAPAMAADVQLPDNSWTGWHVGAGGGYGMVNHNLSLDLFGTIEASLKGIGGEGALGTVEAGYDFELGSGFVLGSLVDYTYSGISTDLSGNIFGTDVDYELEATHQLSALVRVGHLANDTTLMYSLGGYTYTRWNGDLSASGGVDESYDYSTDGLTIGGGIENVIADNITLKLEHRMTFNGTQNIIEVPGLVDLNEKAHVQTARVVLSYRPGVQAAAFDGSESQWTGFHVGAGFGYSMLNHELEADVPGFAAAEFSGVGGEGLLGTLEAGADMLVGDRFVVGLQGGLTLTNAKTTADVDVPGLFTADYELAAKYSFDVLGRAGLLTGPDVLWYGLAGWTRTRFEGDLDVNGASLASYKYDLDGLTVGGGVEVMLTDNVSWKTEYRYTNYERETIATFGTGSLDSKSNQQSVRSVLSLRF